MLVRNINMIVIPKLIVGNDGQQFKAVPSKEKKSEQGMNATNEGDFIFLAMKS